MIYSDNLKQSIIRLVKKDIMHFQIQPYMIEFRAFFVNNADSLHPYENDGISLRWRFYLRGRWENYQSKYNEARCVCLRDFSKCANNKQIMSDIISCMILKQYHEYVTDELNTCLRNKNQDELSEINIKLTGIEDKLKSVNNCISKFFDISLEYAEEHLWWD